MIGVYKIKSKTCRRFYIGSAKDISKRIKQHRNKLRSGKHQNRYLQNVYNKYGEKDFFIITIETSTEEKARRLEQRLLDKYADSKKMMNIGFGATGGDNLSKHPRRKRIIAKMKKTLRKVIDNLSDGERLARYSRAGVNNGMFGKKHSKSSRKQMSQNQMGHVSWSKGLTLPDSTRIKISKAARCRAARPDYVNPFAGKRHSKETRKLISRVVKKAVAGKLPPNTRSVRVGKTEYESLTTAAKFLGVVPATVLYRIRSKNYPRYRYLN
jgi:group I intron endonuclease